MGLFFLLEFSTRVQAAPVRRNVISMSFSSSGSPKKCRLARSPVRDGFRCKFTTVPSSRIMSTFEMSGRSLRFIVPDASALELSLGVLITQRSKVQILPATKRMRLVVRLQLLHRRYHLRFCVCAPAHPLSLQSSNFRKVCVRIAGGRSNVTGCVAFSMRLRTWLMRRGNSALPGSTQARNNS